MSVHRGLSLSGCIEKTVRVAVVGIQDCLSRSSLRLHQAECARCSSGNGLTSSRKIYSAVIMVKRLLVRVYRCIIAADEASLCFSVWRSLSPDRLTHINAYIT